MTAITQSAVFLSSVAPPPGPAPRPPVRTRSRLWELNGSVHCSIIGTCLTTAELRRVMNKVLQGDVSRASDHDLHAQAVGLCLHQSLAAKLLQKALDQRHEAVIKRFARLHGEAAVLAAWAEARQAGDIPGAYWAVLTHPDTGLDGIRRAFGDVHMLSHLVGAANRADIKRLTALEEENAALRAKVERQQARLQQAVTSRDAIIRQLSSQVGRAAAAEPPPPGDDAAAGLRHAVADLQSRLHNEAARRARLEQRLHERTEAVGQCERRAKLAEDRAEAAERELAVVERLQQAPGAPQPLPPCRVLYVGGRPGSVEQMRALLDGAGGLLLSHDGGRHDHPSLLPGLVGQADRVVFPVDCVSHDAALTVKRLCRQLGKRFIPLRSSGLASFLAALAAPHPEPMETAP